MSNSDVSRKVEFGLFKIYFGNVPHLIFRHHQLVGVQAWKSGSGMYFVELTFDHGGVVTSDYDDIEKWKQILGHLEEGLRP